MRNPILCLVAVTSSLGWCPLAAAQDEPPSLLGQDAASAGSTQVATEGFLTPPDVVAESMDATELTLSAGGVLATGNARSAAATGTGNFRVRRADSQFSAAAAGNYGRSSPGLDTPLETTVHNYQGRIRYDYFVTKRLALFVAASARRDTFQGLEVRLNFDPGLAYYFIDAPMHQLWSEIGYDLQRDVRTDEAIATALADEGAVVAKTQTRHHGRLFVGYDNKLQENVGFTTGLEYLQGLSPFEDTATGLINWRLNWDAALTAAISDSFSLATTLSVRFDHNPLPGLRRTDTVSAVNLVYKLL